MSQNHTGKAWTHTCHPTLSFSCCGGVRQPGLLPPGISQHSTHPHWYRTPGSKWWELHLQDQLEQRWKVTEPSSKRWKTNKKPQIKPPINDILLVCYSKRSRESVGRERQQPQPSQMFSQESWRTTTLEETVGGKESTEHSFPLLPNSILAKMLPFWVLWSHSKPITFPARRGGKETTSFYSFNSDKLKQQTRQVLRSRK